MIRVAVGVTLLQNNQILLIPHHNSSNQIYAWYLPGGQVEFGERLHEAAAREVLEETGLEVEVGELIDVRESIKDQHHGIRLTFAGHIVNGELRPDLAHHNPPQRNVLAQWFGVADLEGITYVPRVAVRKALNLEEIAPIVPWLEE